MWDFVWTSLRKEDVRQDSKVQKCLILINRHIKQSFLNLYQFFSQTNLRTLPLKNICLFCFCRKFPSLKSRQHQEFISAIWFSTQVMLYYLYRVNLFVEVPELFCEGSFFPIELIQFVPSSCELLNFRFHFDQKLSMFFIFVLGGFGSSLLGWFRFSLMSLKIFVFSMRGVGYQAAKGEMAWSCERIRVWVT